MGDTFSSSSGWFLEHEYNEEGATDAKGGGNPQGPLPATESYGNLGADNVSETTEVGVEGLMGMQVNGGFNGGEVEGLMMVRRGVWEDLQIIP